VSVAEPGEADLGRSCGYDLSGRPAPRISGYPAARDLRKVETDPSLDIDAI